MPELPEKDGPICPARWTGQQAAVALPEQLGASNAEPVARLLLAILDRRPGVLIADMTATRSCDYAATGVLKRVYRQAIANGIALRLVAPAPVVRRILALSGLDRLVPVYSTVEGAEVAPPPSGVVVPMPPATGSDGLATPALSDSPRPVSRLAAGSAAGDDGFGQAGKEDLDRTLTRITIGLFQAGLMLQASLDQPAEGLRRATGLAIGLLDQTIREARDVTFASKHPLAAASREAGRAEPVAADPDPGSARARVIVGRGATRADLEDLLERSGSSRERARAVQDRALKVAALAAATEDRLAATLNQLAGRLPAHSADLRELSEAAASYAAQVRRWADDQRPARSAVHH